MSEIANRSLIKKLSKVMQEVKYIQKKGYNSFHKYRYATEADVAEKVREILSDQNVMMIPNMTSHSIREHTTNKGNREYIVTVNMEFKFIDGDSGEEITFHMVGEGQDAGDKATYKAITGAQKYALMKAFMIPTGDDPEADESVDERNSNNQSSSPNSKSQQEQKNDATPTIKAKYETWAGNMNGFDIWWKTQREKFAPAQIEKWLTSQLAAKQKSEEKQ